jgi:hypothetical protein
MRIFLVSVAVSVALAGCCCPQQTVESEEQQYRTYLERYEALEDGNEIGRRDKKWLRKKRKKLRKEYKKLPSNEAERLPALSDLTGRMQDVAIEARDRADARKEQTLVPAEKMYLGLGKQDIYIIGKSKEFDLDELEVWMLYRTKAHPPKGVDPVVKWKLKNKEGKYEEFLSLTVDNMLMGDEGLVSIHSNLFRIPEKLKAWPAGKMRVEVWYGDKRVKRVTFVFVD